MSGGIHLQPKQYGPGYQPGRRRAGVAPELMHYTTGLNLTPFWSNISIGDVLEVSTPIKKIRRHSYGSYAPGINIVNLTNESKFNTTMSMAARYLNNIQYTES